MITYSVNNRIFDKYFYHDKIKINVIDTNLTTLKNETITQFKNGHKNNVYKGIHYLIKDGDIFKIEHSYEDETVHYYIYEMNKVINSVDLFEYFKLPVEWNAIIKKEYTSKLIKRNGIYVEDINKSIKYKFFVNVYNLYEGLKEIEKWEDKNIKYNRGEQL